MYNTLYCNTDLEPQWEVDPHLDSGNRFGGSEGRSVDLWRLLLEEVGPPLVCSNSLFLLPKVGAEFREGLGEGGGGC